MSNPNDYIKYTNRFDGVETVHELIYQTIGAASMCWEKVRKAGVFKTDEARAIGLESLAKLSELQKDMSTVHTGNIMVEEHLYYDDMTLTLAASVLVGRGMKQADAMDAVYAMINNGIVFRERKGQRNGRD